MNSAYSLNERATEHCVRMTLSNLVWLDDLDTRRFHSSTTSCVNVEPNRNQRCFRISFVLWCDRVMSGIAKTKADKGFPLDLPPPLERVVRAINHIGYVLQLVSLNSNPIQLDRILGLNKAITASSGVGEFTPSPVGVCRIDWAAQLTQTKQGGCLYEQPDSQSVLMVVLDTSRWFT